LILTGFNKEVLLSTDGKIMACGYIWDIKSKHIGVGVYRVFLRESNIGLERRKFSEQMPFL